MSNTEDIERRLRRLEKAIAAVTDVAIEIKAGLRTIEMELPKLPEKNPHEHPNMEYRVVSRREELKKAFSEDVLQAGGLLPEEL